MKFTWEPGDIQVGRRVTAHNRSEDWMIGYEPLTRREDGNILLFSLKDGMIATCGRTAKQMAQHLNESGSIPLDLRADEKEPRR